jgi:hypothetical protein
VRIVTQSISIYKFPNHFKVVNYMQISPLRFGAKQASPQGTPINPLRIQQNHGTSSIRLVGLTIIRAETIQPVTFKNCEAGTITAGPTSAPITLKHSDVADVTADAAPVRVKNLSWVNRVTTTTAPIIVDKGSCVKEITTDSGPVVLGTKSKACSINTTGGDVTIANGAVVATIDSTSGNFTINGRVGKAHTDGGDITVHERNRGNERNITTGSGRIKWFGIPRPIKMPQEKSWSLW